MDVSIVDNLPLIIVVWVLIALAVSQFTGVIRERRLHLKQGYDWAARRHADGWDLMRIEASRFGPHVDPEDPGARLFDAGIERFLAENGLWANNSGRMEG